MNIDTEKLQVRVHGSGRLPTVVYLPGLHGDWTLIGGFRRAVRDKVRLVELTYPRTLEWSLDDYAAAIEGALAEQGVTHGWLLGESFGSQLVWPLVQRERFKVDGIILAGGFVRHPARWLVLLARHVARGVPLKMITRVLFGYAKVSRWRFRKEPEVLAGVNEFIARRTELDKQAATHRLELIAENDPRPIACSTRVPVYAVTGLLDPVVPWLFVRKWLRSNCPTLREYHIVRGADHNVLGTGPYQVANKLLEWLRDGARSAVS